MDFVGYLAALAAATCWALSSLMSVNPVRTLGPIAFNCLRMATVAISLAAWLVATDQWLIPNSSAFGRILLSGFIGIFVGDTLLFTCLRILGPRLAGLLFATNAPVTFLLSLIFFKEPLLWLNSLGVLLVTGGVFIALSARGNSGQHRWETTTGNRLFGIAAGLGAGLCQSLGALLIVTLLKEGQNPLFATMVRVLVALACLSLALLLPQLSGGFARYRLLTWRLGGQIFVSGMLGMGIGMSLYLLSISLAPVGIATVLSATTPIIVLPLLWLTTGQRPLMISWMAAALVVIGTNMIFLAG